MYLPAAISAGLLRAADTVLGRGVWPAMRELEASQWWPAERLADLQSQKLAGRVRQAAAHSPLFARRLAERGVAAAAIRRVDDLSRLPELTRGDLQDRLDEVRCLGLAEADVLPNSTGGSSGINVRFFVDRACWRQRNAVDLRLWSFLGLRPGARITTVWGSPMDTSQAQQWRKRLSRAMENVRFFSAYRIGGREADRILDWLARRRPDVLMGYASVLDALACRALERGGLQAARCVLSSAEALFPDQRRRIGQGLGAEVYNLYGCREVGLVALECAEHAGLHVMDERLIVERLPAGESGEAEGAGDLLVTDLDNKATPFIRYRIGDLATPPAAGPCACGRGLSRVGEIAGRTFDVIRGPSGGAVGGTFWSLLLRTAVKGIRSFQVVQHETDRLEIRFTPVDGLPDEDRRTVTRMVQEALGTAMRVEFSGHAELQPLASGKHRFVVARRQGDA